MLLTAINLGIGMTILLVMHSDFKRRIIPNPCIVALCLLGGVKIFLQHSLNVLLVRASGAMAVLLLCFLIGYLYQYYKGLDIAGGGDYKLIACFAMIFGFGGVLLCLILELAYEFIYRYVVFPEKKNEGIPLGFSFGAFGFVLLLLGG